MIAWCGPSHVNVIVLDTEASEHGRPELLTSAISDIRGS